MPDLVSSNLSFSILLTAFIGGYFIGAVPFGLVITQLAGLGDIRDMGSGNIGATNVLRTGRKGLAVATLAADILKGTAAVLIGKVLGSDAGLLAGLGAFLGHLYPVWLRFNGGKGVATYIGVLLGLHWPTAIAFCLIWLAVAFLTRYSSLSALIGSLATPAILAAFGEWKTVLLFLVLTLLVFIRHEANIRRLIRGEESKIGRSGK